ncbi:acyl-CoA dehydrogenase family protein [Kitasatospora sp. NPDC056446]|uniref:acyl-CoA dehydrogenase family protein n=1 Tax=Kitasatospora sp. NPDC056446 TaxID=3345819 RepID=UPI0036AF6322
MTTVDRPPGLAAELDRWSEAGGPFDPVLLTRHDEAESFPAEACAALDSHGVAGLYVPCRRGGRLEHLDQLHASLRAVAARDITVAVAHGKTFLGAASVWVGGDAAQAESLARHVLAGEAVAWGLTEPGRGSDLLAGEVTAVREGPGWRLNGRKWPVNNATRGRFLCVLARTDPAGGPRGFSVFLVDKHELAVGAVRPMPKLPTHGIRGADISGVEFDDALVPGRALVGDEGAGIELSLKALQLTRTACVALSLGAGDHGLRLLRRFLRERRLHGRWLADLPHARVVAGRAVARLMLAEAVAATSAAVAHEAPGELAAVSAIAKALAPTLIQGQLRLIGELLGARGFLLDVEGYGAFGKLERDHQVVSIFDGSTWVNRAVLAAHLPLLVRTPAADRPAPVTDWLRADGPRAPLDPSALAPLSRGDTVLGALDALAARVDPGGTGGADGPARALADAKRALFDAIRCLCPTAGAPATATMRLAERYEWCWAGAAALALWTSGPVPEADVWWRGGSWLRGCLALVLEQLGDEAGGRADAVFDELGSLVLSDAGAHPSLFRRPLEDLR